MARKRRQVKAGECSGTYFKMKTARGSRCVCAAFDEDGNFSSQFASNDACPMRGKAITFKQARKKYEKLRAAGKV